MRVSACLALALVAGCQHKGTDLGPTCEGTAVPVALDEVTAIGVVPADLIKRIPTHQDADFVYANADTTTIALDFTVGDEATFTDQTAVYPEGTTIDIGIICDDFVAINVDFTFATADGVFDEAVSTQATVTEGTLGQIGAPLDLAALGGTFVIDDYTDGTAYDDARLRIALQLHDDGFTTGEINGDISGQEACADAECSAWDMAVDVGSYGPGLE